MQRRTLIGLLLIFSTPVFSQRKFFERADSIHKTRVIGVSTSIGTIWPGSVIGLSQVWYNDTEKSTWHTFDDSRNWLQMDKAGHFYSGYKLNQFTADAYQWAGVTRRTSVWIGTGVSIGYLTTFEMLDAYSAAWGFSWTDVAANTLGAISYSAQVYFWEEERIIPKFSYSPSPFAAIRPSVLGSSFSESLLKDYNGQTYWLSVSPGTFVDGLHFPKWLCFSLGYSAHEKLTGSEEVYIDPTTNIQYKAQREFLLSMDIDFSKLNIRRPWLRVLVKQLNYLKVPFPAIRLRGNELGGSLLYF